MTLLKRISALLVLALLLPLAVSCSGDQTAVSAPSDPPSEPLGSSSVQPEEPAGSSVQPEESSESSIRPEESSETPDQPEESSETPDQPEESSETPVHPDEPAGSSDPVSEEPAPVEIDRTGVEFGKIYEPVNPQLLRFGNVSAESQPKVFCTRKSLDEYLASDEWKGLWANYLEIIKCASAQSYIEACGRYDEDFFRDNFLVIVFDAEPSGSNNVVLTGGSVDEDGVFKLFIELIIPEVGTCDMAYWFIFAGFPKSLAPEDGGVELEKTVTYINYNPDLTTS